VAAGLVAGLAFAALRTFLPRPGAGHCPHCGYDLRATARGAPCPECGRTVTGA
jgi:rubrerythrin